MLVSGVNRTNIAGSYLISTFSNHDGQRKRLGTEAILSRWHIGGCMNCQTHLEARAHIPPLTTAHATIVSNEVEFTARGHDAELAAALGEGSKFVMTIKMYEAPARASARCAHPSLLCPVEV